MNRLRSRGWKRRLSKSGVSFALAPTAILILAAGLFAIIQIFSTVTMTCRQYYDWHLFNREINGSLLQTLLVFTAAIFLYFLADILRPKRQRVAYLVRAFQLFLIFSMAAVTFIQSGLLLPHESHAESSRSLHLALERVFMIQQDRVHLDIEDESGAPRPAQRSRSFQDNSPFAIKDGLLRCEVEAQVEALRQEQNRTYRYGITPFAITEPRRSKLAYFRASSISRIFAEAGAAR